MERLAETLEVTIVELMQAKRNESETISAQEAERLLSETIHMSKRPNGLSKTIGGIILLTFGVIIVFLMKLFFTDMTVVEYSVGSIVIGLIAWAIPIWQITFVRNPDLVFIYYDWPECYYDKSIFNKEAGYKTKQDIERSRK